jgi:hypothetical protein
MARSNVAGRSLVQIVARGAAGVYFVVGKELK